MDHGYNHGPWLYHSTYQGTYNTPTARIYVLWLYHGPTASPIHYPGTQPAGSLAGTRVPVE